VIQVRTDGKQQLQRYDYCADAIKVMRKRRSDVCVSFFDLAFEILLRVGVAGNCND
jgi:hypothetical protein